MRKILVPFDGSDSAIRAVRYAARLAQDIPAMQLELLHVFQRTTPGLDDLLQPDEYERLHADELARILDPAMQLLDEARVRYQSRCRVGSPGSEIARYAYEAGCESIVMGTRGMGPVASFFIGSVATRVVNLVSVPVTLVK